MINKQEVIKQYKPEKTILYLIKKMGEKVEGKKKLMKLIFLLEYYSPITKKIEPSLNFDRDYSVYYYGVYSSKIMDSIRNLISSNYIKDGFPLKMERNIEIVLDPELQNKVDTIINTFGDMTGYQLERLTLQMLGVNIIEKREYFGISIEEIIKQKQFT